MRLRNLPQALRQKSIGIAVTIFALVAHVEAQADKPFVIVPHDDSTRVEVQTGSPIGRIELWVPEAIMSERGACSIYPKGAEWRQVNGGWEQTIGTRQTFGPGNCRRISDDAVDVVGFELPIDSSVTWTTRLTPGPQRVAFEIRLRNIGKQTIRRAGAAVCVKFIDASWWSDKTTFAISDGAATSLATLGHDAGPDNGFEAYLVRGETFANPFYIGFWGFNRHRLDDAILVSEHHAARCCAVVTSERAYFMHSNRHNPCTDLMLALGNVAPGAEVVARSIVSIESGRAKEVFAKKAARHEKRGTP